MQGRIAVVTGAAGALGLATTDALLADGLRVALVDLESSKLQAAAASRGQDALAVPCDVTRPDSVRSATRAIEARWSAPASILINNAGVLSAEKAVSTTPEEWRRVLAVNLDGAFYFAQALLPGMRANGWGRIVNTCSFAAKSGGLTAGTAYTVSKGGLISLTFSLARETVHQGITVNGIAPAYIKTAMLMEQMTEEQRQAVLKQIPVGRFCEPEEFAHAVRFFVSPLAGFITGEILDMNGGLQFD